MPQSLAKKQAMFTSTAGEARSAESTASTERGESASEERLRGNSIVKDEVLACEMA